MPENGMESRRSPIRSEWHIVPVLGKLDVYKLLVVFHSRTVVAAAAIGYPCGLETLAELYWETPLFNR